MSFLDRLFGRRSTSRLWRCPGCRKIWAKGDDNLRRFNEAALRSGSRISGGAKCPNCGKAVSVSDVYKGKYDVDEQQF